MQSIKDALTHAKERMQEKVMIAAGGAVERRTGYHRPVLQVPRLSEIDDQLWWTGPIDTCVSISHRLITHNTQLDV